MALSYDIMMKVRRGTKKLVHESNGMEWRDETSIITWCREYSLADCMATCKKLQETPSNDVLLVYYHVVNT